MSHNHPHLTHPRYRADIDGLRAVAIIAVVVFHAFPWRMPGGFIGVDIFFVISGYLISTIIFSSLEKNRFSLLEFYVRRIRRIFPALILVLVSCLVAGWVILFDDEYRQLFLHTVASAGFIENFILWREGGYFDNAAEAKPLLHLWSLAIEEQFYIFWPLLLAFVWKRNWNFFSITVVIAGVSFAANIHLIYNNQSSAFYFPISRFWELMIGGMLAYTTIHHPELINRHKNVQSITGFSLLFAGLILINRGNYFPGWWALLPTLGTFLVISAGPTAWLNQKLLANRLMVWIGLISYPLYLWHWPLLSFLTIEEGELSRTERIGAVIVAVILSWLTYRFIERPFRFGRNPGIKAAALAMAMSVLILPGIFFLNLVKFEGIVYPKGERSDYLAYFENSVPDWKFFRHINLQKKIRSDCDFYDLEKYRTGQATEIPRPAISKSCYTRDTKYSHSLLLWGDSHAQMLYHGIEKNLPDDWQILLGVSSGCPANPDISAPSATRYCDQSNWLTLQTITKAKPDVVIVAQNLDHSLDKMNHIARKLQDMNVQKILFTGPSPHWKPELPKLIARKLWHDTPKRTYTGIDHSVIRLNNTLKSGFRDLQGPGFISLIDFFCNPAGCLTYLGNDRKLGITTYDDGHLTPVASEFLAKELLVNLITAPFKQQSP